MHTPATLSIGHSILTAREAYRLAVHPQPIQLAPEARERIRSGRAYLDGRLAGMNEVIYGINTGFGSLCNVVIPQAELEQLQLNLVLSHAAGLGDLSPVELSRLMLLLKIQGLSQGYSGVREIVVDRLIDFFNARLAPVVYELGSLGASGDLAPLAHLSLPLIGRGEVWHNSRRLRADVALQLFGWEPLVFQAKEALALLNGTQFSAAYMVYCLMEGERLLELADLNAAISYDGFNCRYDPLNEHLHRIRPHQGQLTVAARVRKWLEGSQIGAVEKNSVQDPYAFRCVPQVHGASRAALAHAAEVLQTEINAVTDNPVVLPEQGLILSGGHFHAQPLALPLDYMALALSELGSISERRLYQLISGQRGLPAFLTDNPGLHSGLMIAQYTAAAMVSQNKTLCMPASADSIVSSNGQEDHVSMAANAGTKCRHVVQNLERLLAIEFMAGMQALDYRLPLHSSEPVESLRQSYRERVPRLAEDRILSTDIETTVDFLRSLDLTDFVNG